MITTFYLIYERITLKLVIGNSVLPLDNTLKVVLLCKNLCPV